MREIKLSQGKNTIVDNDDYEYLNQWKWYCCKGYAVRHPKMVNGVRKGKIAMHRVIRNTPPGKHTDHINGDTLDNRRSNLRIVNSHQNIMNSGMSRNNTSGYKGVTWRKREGKWQARISAYGKRYNLGDYDSKEEANVACRVARRLLQGEYERRN